MDSMHMTRFGTHPPGHPFALRGSLICARGTGILSRAIRWAEREKDEEASWANHVGICTRSGFLVPPHPEEKILAHVSESLWKVEDGQWWARHRGEQGYAVAVFHPRGLSASEIGDIVADAKTRTGQKYGWWRLFTFLGERLTGLPFTKLHFQGKRIVCSNHVGRAYEAGNVTFPEGPGQLDPDDIMDYCMSDTTNWSFEGWAICPGVAPR